MEKYSEAKTYKSKPELRKGNVKADLFLFIGGNKNYCQSQGVCPGVCKNKPRINGNATANVTDAS